MAIDIRPQMYIPGLAGNDGDFITVLGNEAASTNGDIRKMMHKQIKNVYSTYLALPVADRPTKFTITKSVPTGINANTIRQSYTMTFDFNTDEVDLADEPVPVT